MSEKREHQGASLDGGAFVCGILFTAACIFARNLATQVFVSYLLKDDLGGTHEHSKATDTKDGPTGDTTRGMMQRPHNMNLEKQTQAILASLTGGGHEGTMQRVNEILQRHGRKIDASLKLTRQEARVAQGIIDPAEMESGFGDVAGLDDVKQEIFELVVLPILRPEVFASSSSKLIRRTSGILLYGKPGCGKTLLAKAIAKESGAIFIPIELSSLLNSLAGESEKMVAATFSLARKLAPSVIFFDELDCVCGKRSSQTRASPLLDCVKNCFLTSLDGVSTVASGAPVTVLGATNQPQIIDTAILRRFPLSFAIPMPNSGGREEILHTLLKEQSMHDAAKAFLPKLANDLTEGYSGSDLKELCSAAARGPVREAFAAISKRAVCGENDKESSPSDVNDDGGAVPTLRPVSENDCRVALEKVKPTGKAAEEYAESELSLPAELRNSLYI